MVIEHSFINKSYTSKINSASLWWRSLLKFIEIYGKTTVTLLLEEHSNTILISFI